MPTVDDEVEVGSIVPDIYKFWAKVREERVADAVIQSRCDSRTLATFAAYFYERGLMLRSVAELVRLALEFSRFILVAAGELNEIVTAEDAVMTLSRLGLDQVNPRYGRDDPRLRGLLQRMKQVQRENRDITGDPEPIVRTKGKLISEAKDKRLKEAFQEALPRVMAELTGQTPQEGEDIRAIFNTSPREKNSVRIGTVKDTPEEDSKAALAAHRLIEDTKQLDELRAGLASVPKNLIAKEEKDGDSDESSDEKYV